MRHQILPIQALRALAAIVVTTAHARVHAESVIDGPAPWPSMVTGAAGVDLFFVISGFIMVYASGGLYGSATAPLTFLTRRAIRIYPMVWFATGLQLFLWFVIFGTSLITNATTWGGIFWNSLLITVPRLDGNLSPFLGVTWTLHYEAFFYLVFAVCLLLPRRLCVLVAGVFLYWMAFYSSPWLASAPKSITFVANAFLVEFVYGMAIGLAYVEGLRLPRWLSALLAIVGFALIAASGYDLIALRREHAWGLGGALLVAGAVFAGQPARQGRFLRLNVLLGDSSYALYLTHGFILPLFWWPPLGWVGRPLAAISPWLLLTVMVGFSIVAAVIVHLLLERPLTRWLRRVAERPRPVPAMVQTAP